MMSVAMVFIVSLVPFGPTQSTRALSKAVSAPFHFKQNGVEVT
jgi:hypothetical protein